MVDPNQFDLIQNSLERLEVKIEVMKERAEEDRVKLQENKEQHDRRMASLNAVIGRLDAILDRLISQG